MRILATGAAGFIGRYCTAELVRRGHEVHGVIRAGESEGSPDVSWHRAELLSERGATDVLESVRPTHLLHLAWVTAHGEFWTSPLNDDWLSASRRLIRQFAASGGKRVIVAGTVAEYDWSHGVCDEGTTPLAPVSRYGKMKNALREDLESSAQSLGLSWAWGRVFWLYGPGEPRARLVPSIIESLLRDQPALCTAGLQRRDFLFAGDTGAGLARLTESDVGGAVNVASGHPVAIADIARTIGRLMGKEHLLRMGAKPSAPDEPPLVVAATGRLRNEVGFSPTVEIEEGLGLTIEAARETFRHD